MTNQKKPIVLRACEWLEKKLPGITIKLPDPTDEGKKKPYLTRSYVLLKDWKWFNVFLHHFHRSDLEVGEGNFGLLHSHPWQGSLSLVLWAGYSEEKLMEDGTVIRRQIKPWHFNIIRHSDFHRVDLNRGEAWTLFFTGSRTKDGNWFFYDRVSKEKRHFSTSPNAIP